MSSTLKLDSFRTRGGSFSLVGMDVISNKPKRTITRGRISCVTIAFLSRLEFKNLFMNIALYWCHFNFMPVSSPKNKNVQINQNVILSSYYLSIRLIISKSVSLSIFLSAYPSVRLLICLSGHLSTAGCLFIRLYVCFSVSLSVGQSVHLFVYLIFLSAACLSVCLPICP